MARIAKMKVWNVELGLAVHIKAPNGKYIVIDLGSSETVSPINSLPNFMVKHMVITHPHHDHISDIDNLSWLKKPNTLWRVKALSRDDIIPNVDEDYKDKFNKYFDFVESYNQSIEPLNSPSNENTFDGLTAEVFQATGYSGSNINNYSGIVVLRLGNAKIIVCGDNQNESFKELMDSSSFKDAVKNAWVLVAAHHGRESGYYKDFVELVRPYITIISDTHKSKTSVTEKYTDASNGYDVFDNSSGKTTKRKCLTTRNDGNITVEFGETDDTNYIGTLYVECNV